MKLFRTVEMNANDGYRVGDGKEGSAIKEQIILVYPPQGKGAPFRLVYKPDKPTPPEAFGSALRTAFNQSGNRRYELLDWCNAIDKVVAELGGSWNLLEYDVTVWL